MKLYEKCLQFSNLLLTDDVGQTNSLVAIENDGTTIPLSVKQNGSIETFLCSNIYNICSSIYYISDIHLVHHIQQEFNIGTSNAKVKSYIKRVVNSLFKGEFLADIQNGKQPIVLFGGDISPVYEVSELFYTEFINRWNKIDSQSTRTWKKERYIYAILGNHELWDFSDLETCYSAYQNLFSSLDICFLNNEVTWFGYHNQLPKEALPTAKSKRSKRYISDTIQDALIVGGIGFAGYNQEFNANQGIYRTTLTRQQEIEQTAKWEETYSHALTMAKEVGGALIVLTHTPFTDWKANKTADNNCIYFSGHTHRNYVSHEEEKGVHIFSDNQIGYRNCKIEFKRALLYNRVNPFVGFTDGYYEISSSDYLKFYDYMDEWIEGNGQVERQIKINNARFFMVKHDGYYGFFLISPKASYICAGGRIKKIGTYIDIEEFDSLFTEMVNKYLQILYPYRRIQEQVAAEVRRFGGIGSIHGTIVDIDCFNHIMMNPVGDKITYTYYYAPVFGTVQTYGNILELLESRNPALANNFRMLKVFVQKAETVFPEQNQIASQGKMMKVDIKNSPYAFSNRLNQLQRLFDKKILRDWNEELLFGNITKDMPLLPREID